MVTSNSQALRHDEPPPFAPTLSRPKQEALDQTLLCNLEPEAVESLEEAVAIVIELGELAIQKGGDEGALPPLQAIAIDPFGSLSIVGEDATTEHPVRMLVRTLKSLIRRFHVPAELGELILRNSGKGHQLDYTEEFVNALAPFAPTDRGDALSAVAKRLWLLGQGTVVPTERHRSAVMYVPVATQKDFKAETRDLGNQLSLYGTSVVLGGFVLLFCVAVIGVLFVRGSLHRAVTPSLAPPDPQVQELTVPQTSLPESASISLPVKPVDPPMPTPAATPPPTDIERPPSAAPETKATAPETKPNARAARRSTRNAQATPPAAAAEASTSPEFSSTISGSKPPAPVVSTSSADTADAASVPAKAPSRSRRVYSARDEGVDRPTLIRPDESIPGVVTEVRTAGSGTLELLINEDGSVERVRSVTRRGPRADTAAVNAAKDWKFVPAMKEGQPVKYRAVVRIPAAPAVP